MNLHLLNAMFWFIPYFQITCLGLFFFKIFRFGLNEFYQLQYVFWLGFGGLIASLQILHFFFPVSREVVWFFFILSFLGLALSARELFTLFKKIKMGHVAFFLLALGFVFLWIFSQRQVVPVRYDTGLYHIQMINWLTQYPDVPGLGNLHVRFAFPQSFLFYPAFMEKAYSWMGGFYVCSFLLIANILFEWTLGIRNIILKSDFTSRNLFRALLILPVVLYRCYDNGIVTASPDTAIFLFQLAIMVLFFQLFSEPTLKIKLLKSPVLFVFVFLSLVGITIKSYYMVFGVIALVIIGIRGGLRSNVWLFLGLIAAIVVPFFLRNVLLSGYLLYPSSFWSFSVDWKIPEFIRNVDFICTAGMAKIQDCRPIAITDYTWFIPWLRLNLQYNGEPFFTNLGLIVFGFLFSVFSFLKRPVKVPILNVLEKQKFKPREERRKGKQEKVAQVLPCDVPAQVNVFFLILPAVFSSLAAFLFSPDCRFFGSTLWVVGMVLCATALSRQAFFLEWMKFRWLTLLAVVVFIFVIMHFVVIQFGKNQEQRWHIPSVGKFLQVQMGPEIKVLKIQAPDDRCWGAPLPCTPDRIGGLELRDPKRIQAGFTRRNDSPERSP